MRAPDFWHGRGGGVVAALLTPLGSVYGLAARARFAAARPWRASIPVLCVGNLVAGGSGKTPVALSLGARLARRGDDVHFLTRGYGGRRAGPLRVDPDHHGAREVGDEALLLARCAPAWVARDRPAGCRAAIAGGARAIIMDDGFQNPYLAKDVSLLVVDGAYGFGNGRVMPAGPLREPVEAGLARADALVLIGADGAGVVERVGGDAPTAVPILRARIMPGPEAARLAGKSVVAFAGIGNPERFFTTLRDLGCRVEQAHAFPDHYPYDSGEVESLRKDARALDALLVTTAKDLVRLPPAARDGIEVLTIIVEWEDEAAVDDILERLMRHGR